jgi:hypothetical protein
MAQLDPVIIRRRRLAALGILAILVVTIWSVSQFAVGQDQAEVDAGPQETEVGIAAEITDCAPGVVSLTAMIGTFDEATKANSKQFRRGCGSLPLVRSNQHRFGGLQVQCWIKSDFFHHHIG